MIETLIALGYKLVPVDGKRPTAKDWPTHDFTLAEIEQAYKQYAEPGVGIKLENLLDFDGDGPNAAEMAASLNLPESVAWTSARGRHELFGLTPEQAAFFATSGKIKLGDLELRTGLNSQSVLPPSGGRKWITPLDEYGPCKLPDSVFEQIKLLANPKKPDSLRNEQPESKEPKRPGDIYNESVSWGEILEPLGWRCYSDKGGQQNWTRPGKTVGLSATTGHCQSDRRGDLFYCFSSAPEIEPIEPNKSYSKFELFALIHHDNNYSAAAASVTRSGYAPENSRGGDEFDDFPETDPFPIQENETIQEMPVLKEIYKPILTDAPEPSSEVYDFVLGKYVQELIPYTEAYPPAILFQLMEVTGILAGRRTYFAHGDYKFRLNGGTIVIGESGISRKGTGLHYARLPFADQDNEMDINAIISETDQVSGEGFIQALANKPNHTMLIACEEFAGVLKSTKREGSSLSPVIRKALDAKPLGIDSRKNKIDEMHDAFASIIGHCTLDEFIENISIDDIRNGFLNRFQFTMSRQNSKIAFPEAVPEHVKVPVREAFSKIMGPKEFGENVVVTFAPDARPVWEEFYTGKGKVQSSLRSSLGARTPSQVLRNAARIALLEGSTQVDARRLRISLAMQQYGADCIDYIFGDYINADEEEIIQFLMSDKNGKTWHDINEWVARWKKPKRQTRKLITHLTDKGIIAVRPVKTVDGAGRPANRLFVTQAATK